MTAAVWSISSRTIYATLMLSRVPSRGGDYVVHLAANTGVRVSMEYPVLDGDVNVAGTFNVLEAAREARAPGRHGVVRCRGRAANSSDARKHADATGFALCGQ